QVDDIHVPRGGVNSRGTVDELRLFSSSGHRVLQGVVTIEAKVNSRGTVDELRLFSSSGHRVLDKAALRAVRAWRFSPGTVGGRAQSMWVKVPVRFTLR
ncbi:MAG: energy transducer TonB, partial [Candidatus Electrothrix sp. AS4_5]|nr:energy transducer TonB [Candidatus Electrothrix gigas]